jgi:hypothetical protein
MSNVGWFASTLPAYRAFLKASRNPEGSQMAILKQILAKNSSAAYGRQHDFAHIRTYADFIKLPLCNYADISRFIERIARGEKNVLAAEDVLSLVPTSGTSNATKLIPYTNTLLREFQAALEPWIASLFLSRPGLLFGKHYWVTTPHTPPDSIKQSAVKIGFMDDSSYLNRFQRLCCRRLMCIPPEAAVVSDTGTLLYLTALFLLREPNLRLISLWHPSFLKILTDTIEKHYAELVHDIEHGTLSASSVTHAGTRDVFKKYLYPSPERARFLKNIMSPSAGLAQIWPRLKLLSCWTDGWSVEHMPLILAQCPSSIVEGKGLLATEGVFSIPLGRNGHKAAAVRSHFYEFIDAESGEVHPLWGLHKGKVYSTVVTNGGGLYRYQMHDLVRVTGFFNQVPILDFVSRDNCVSDMVGEKLHLEHIESLIKRCEEACTVCFRFAMFAPLHIESRYGYVFYYSSDMVPDAPILQSYLERELMRNYYYRHARDLGQLQPLRLFRASGNPLPEYYARLTASGAAMGDLKVLALRRETDWQNTFTGSFTA